MSEGSLPDSPQAVTAGALLRQARQAKGLHLVALAASLKVAPARLEAMEADRWSELPDAAYARALAHTVCRVLSIDPDRVLRELPSAVPPRLESLDEGLDQPFRERPAGGQPGHRRLRGTVVALGLVLAVGVWWFLDHGREAPPSDPAAASSGAGGAPARAEPASSPRVDAVPAPRVDASSSTRAEVTSPGAPAVPADLPARAPGAGLSLRIVASQASWIELRDPRGQVLMSRLLASGESVELAQASAANLTVGNAAATQLWVDGRAIDLRRHTRENVARVDLP
ncbi:MAG: helix-turn-helix domain-containing protein [Rubrivivax sp.]